MGKGSTLTEKERGKIDAYHAMKMSYAAIAAEIGRSKTVVANYLKAPDEYGSKKRTGRRPKLNARARMCLVREGSKGQKTASMLHSSCSVPVSTRTIQRVLQSAPHLHYVKMKKTPKLLLRHTIARLEWARTRHRDRTNWDVIVFSDEKRFNLDGPDGCKYYWHDLRTEPREFYSRQNGGGGIMVWAAFSAKGKSAISILVGRQDSLDYQETLTNYLFPFVDDVHADGYVFQQDNASIHASRSTTEFLRDLNIAQLDWPALSPCNGPTNGHYMEVDVCGTHHLTVTMGD